MCGFRGFESYALDKLARVNLVVGRNNSGKTSVLEAIELLVSRGDVGAIQESASRRGEMSFDDRTVGPFRRLSNISHLFYGHRCDPGSSFELAAPGLDTLKARLWRLDDLDEQVLGQVFAERLPEDVSPEMGLTIGTGAEPVSGFRITEDGVMLYDVRRRRMRRSTQVRFLSLTSIDPPFVSETWDALLSDGREAEIAEDMRLLIPEIESIHFLTSGRLSQGATVVGLRGGGPRVPLGSFGDGMRRLLLLRLSLANKDGGCVLVDEIDTGLHWTVMEGMWWLVVEVAVKANLQIFATTHSYDCIRGLAMMLQSHPELSGEVSIQKVDTSLEQAVNLSGREIPVAVGQGTELR